MINSASRDCAIVVSTCDNYSDIWELFFTLFQKFWPDNPYPVFLNSETLDYRNDNMAVTTLKARTAELSWTRRLKEALERVESDYIVFMLDDFFLFDYVDTSRIEECVTYMRRDSNIAAIYLTCLGYQMEACALPGLEKCKHTSEMKAPLTIALWRKNTFLYYLDHDESPWEFELNSLERGLKRGDTFYSISKNVPTAIPYHFYGLVAGKWFRPTVELLNARGITHDFSLRGFCEVYEVSVISHTTRCMKKMDSYLVPCYSLTRDNPRVDTDKVVEEGYFFQIYDVTGAQSAAVWYPFSIYGFAVENFKCTIMFKSGITKTLGAEDVFGNFALYRGAMFFLWPGVAVYILPDIKQEMLRITIEGHMNKHLSKDDMAAAYGMDVRVALIGQRSLIDENKIYAEPMLIPENFYSFRISSKLCFQYNGNFDDNTAILAEKDRFPGSFMQSYKIDKSAERIVRWDIGGSMGWFAVEGLQIEIIYGDGVPQFLEPSNIIGGSGVLINGYWVFLSSFAHLVFSLPERRPDEIRINGNVMAPIPRKVLRAVIYGDDRTNGVDDKVSENKGKEKNGNRLLNFNGLQFMLSIVKRGVKKYGIIGVVKEAIRRVFCR